MSLAWDTPWRDDDRNNGGIHLAEGHDEMRLCNPLGFPVAVPALLLAGLIGACDSRAPLSDAAIGMDGLTSDMSSDLPGCTDGESIVYLGQGCDGTARWFCQGPVLDACAAIVYYCGCDGKTVLGSCGGASPKPYSATGRCPETNQEVRDSSMGDATCAPTPDEKEKQIDRRLVYTAPGCDVQATLVCEGLVADAAVVGKLLCGCDGKTFQGAGSPEGRLLYSERPYRFEGCCPEDPPMFFANQCTNLRDAAAQ
jgi:hypothetical protein